MTNTELLAIFREEVSDQEAAYLWADTLIYRYIDDAQKQFCRDTYGIADSRSFRLNIAAGTEWYAIDPKILKLRDAIDPHTGRDVPIYAIEKMRDNGLTFAPTLTATELAAVIAASAAAVIATPTLNVPTQALVTGLDDGYLRAYPFPIGPTVVHLRTFRLPETLAVGDEFEIAEQHHLHLLHWVKHRAYDVQDSEVFNKNASMTYEAKHKAYCAKAKAEQDRLFRPVSAVTYGGI